MRSSKKKARGRPRGRTKPHRPVLSVRVPEDVYVEIQTSARASGRTISEETVWRTRQSFEWEKANGTVQAWLTEARRTTDHMKKVSQEQALREWGYNKVVGVNGDAAWFGPGVHAPKWIFAHFNADTRVLLQEMLDQAAMRAVEKMKEAQS